MPVPFITCRNKVTGAEADLPETALTAMTNWVPLDDGASDPVPADEPTPAEAKTATASTTKSKAATTAANEKE